MSAWDGRRMGGWVDVSLKVILMLILTKRMIW